MKKIIDYAIVAGDPPNVAEQVKKLYNEGWEPQGGLSITNFKGMSLQEGILVAQALVKYEKEIIMN